jgi:hypothetical protein
MCSKRIWVTAAALVLAAFGNASAFGADESADPAENGNARSRMRWTKFVPVPDPFHLTADQAEELDRLLVDWETRQRHVRTLSCNFTLWEYDRHTCFPCQPRQYEGELKYAWPDKAHFHILGDEREEWLRDGRDVIEMNHRNREIRQYRLPADRIGKPIQGWPLPFLYGVNSVDLRSRYWIRITTPEDAIDQVCLEFRPREIPERSQIGWLEKFAMTLFLALRNGPFFQFERADLILTKPALQPYAIRFHYAASHSRKVFMFDDLKLDAAKPEEMDIRVPTRIGWRRIVTDIPAESFHVDQIEQALPVSADDVIGADANGKNRESD